MERGAQGTHLAIPFYMCVCVCVCVWLWFAFNHVPVSNSFRPHRLWPFSLLCPWNFPGKSTGVDCYFFLQRIFPTQGSNPHLFHWQVDSLPLHQPGRPSKWPDLRCCCSAIKSCPTLCDPMDCSRLGFPVPHHLPEFAQVDLRYLPKRFIPLKYNNNYNKISCYVTHLFTIFKVYCLEMDIGLISIVIPSGVFLHQVLKYGEHIIVQRSLLLLHGWSFFWSLNYFGSFYRCLPCILYCRI